MSGRFSLPRQFQAPELALVGWLGSVKSPSAFMCSLMIWPFSIKGSSVSLLKKMLWPTTTIFFSLRWSKKARKSFTLPSRLSRGSLPFLPSSYHHTGFKLRKSYLGNSFFSSSGARPISQGFRNCSVWRAHTITDNVVPSNAFVVV